MPPTKEEILEFQNKETKKRIKKLIAKSNIPEKYLKYSSLEDYKEKYDQRKVLTRNKVIESRAKAKKAIGDYLSNLEFNVNTGKSIFLSGLKGSGKSVLGTLVLKDIINNLKKEVFYVRFNRFYSDAQTTHIAEDLQNLMDRHLEPEVLMIDEFNNDADKNGKGMLYFTNILEQRVDNNKPTIITSTIDIEGLKWKYGTDLVSFLKDYYSIIDIESETEEGTVLAESIDMGIIKKDAFFNIDHLIDNLTAIKKRQTLEENKLRIREKGLYKEEEEEGVKLYDKKFLYMKGSEIIAEVNKCSVKPKKRG